MPAIVSPTDLELLEACQKSADLRRATVLAKDTFAELKGEFALDVVPTKHYGANSAWQQLSVLAYNLARSFQLDTGAASLTGWSHRFTGTGRIGA